MSVFISNIIGFLVSLIFYIIIFNIKDDAASLKLVALFINTLIMFGVFLNFFRDFKKDNYIKELKKYIDNLRKKENTFFLYYNETKEKSDKLIRIKHDIKNELQVAYAMANKCKKTTIKLLDDLDNKLEDVKIINFCKNPVLNTVLTIKKLESENENVILNFDIDKSFDLKMEEIDICDLFSNILDNSIEAIKNRRTNKKRTRIEYNENDFIKLSVAQKNDYIIIKCKNTYGGDIKRDKENGNKFITSKLNNKEHGYGMDIIKSVVNKYNGELNIETKNNIFEIIIIFRGILC